MTVIPLIPANADEPLDVGSRVVYRGEFGEIIGDGEGPPGPYWRIRLDSGEIAAPFAGDPYLARLDRQSYVRAILNSVAARHLPVDRAAELIDLVSR